MYGVHARLGPSPVAFWLVSANRQSTGRSDSRTDVSWLATVIRSDFRMYEGEGVQSLMNEVVSTGRFLGRSKAEIERWLGPPTSTEPGLRPSLSVFRYDLGTVPPSMRAGPPSLLFDFDESGRCREMIPFMSY
jgi:hypothetical protein